MSEERPTYGAVIPASQTVPGEIRRLPTFGVTELHLPRLADDPATVGVWWIVGRRPDGNGLRGFCIEDRGGYENAPTAAQVASAARTFGAEWPRLAVLVYARSHERTLGAYRRWQSGQEVQGAH